MLHPCSLHINVWTSHATHIQCMLPHLYQQSVTYKATKQTRKKTPIHPGARGRSLPASLVINNETDGKRDSEKLECRHSAQYWDGQLCIALQLFVISAFLSTFEKNPFSLKFRRLLYNLHQGTEEPRFHVCVLCKGKGKALQKTLPNKDSVWYRQGAKPKLCYKRQERLCLVLQGV